MLDKSTAALNFDHFKYDLNTTSCSDNTKCPGPQNQTCCDAKNGKKEINFDNNAIIPQNRKDLSTYYEAAGYTIPSRRAESTGSTAQQTPHSSTRTGSPSTAARDIDQSIGTSTSRLSPSSVSFDGRDQPFGGSGLSTSAQAIVGATVSLVSILLLVSCLYVIRRHRMKHRAVRSIEPEVAEYSQSALTARNLCELQGSQAGVEMATPSNSVAELAGGKQGRITD